MSHLKCPHMTIIIITEQQSLSNNCATRSLSQVEILKTTTTTKKNLISAIFNFLKHLTMKRASVVPQKFIKNFPSHCRAFVVYIFLSPQNEKKAASIQFNIKMLFVIPLNFCLPLCAFKMRYSLSTADYFDGNFLFSLPVESDWHFFFS